MDIVEADLLTNYSFESDSENEFNPRPLHRIDEEDEAVFDDSHLLFVKPHTLYHQKSFSMPDLAISVERPRSSSLSFGPVVDEDEVKTELPKHQPLPIIPKKSIKRQQFNDPPLLSDHILRAAQKPPLPIHPTQEKPQLSVTIPGQRSKSFSIASPQELQEHERRLFYLQQMKHGSTPILSVTEKSGMQLESPETPSAPVEEVQEMTPITPYTPYSRVSIASEGDMSITMATDKEMQLLGKAIRHVYTPSFVKRGITDQQSTTSNDVDSEISAQDSVSFVPSEQPRRPSRQEVLSQMASQFQDADVPQRKQVRLKRSKSWTKTSTIARTLTGTTNVSEPLREFESVMISSQMGKRNRRGRYQKRLIRFDGFLFVCLSERKLPTAPAGRKITDFDLVDSVDSIVQHVLGPLMRNMYPSSQLLSIASAIISESYSGIQPNINATRYHIPKVMIFTLVDYSSHEYCRHQSRSKRCPQVFDHHRPSRVSFQRHF
ncbi:hypothetical protein EDD86DRAFT_13014 [Gorgonomyces haynaldii]|nr:hypothetical protein EDD86DRAFT_13014 [Gorgonomyces haynaldii]